MSRDLDLEFYKDRRGLWRWRLVSANGRIMADSGEGYASKGNARRGWERLVALIGRPSEN